MLRNKIAIIAIAVISLLGVAGCSQGDETQYTNKQNTEEAVVKEQKAGTIEYSFPTPPTLEKKASSQIKDVGSIADVGDMGVLAISADQSQIFRIINGSKVWSSKKETTTLKSVKFVNSDSRNWIIIVRESGEKQTVSVYDAYAYSENQEPLRKQDFNKATVTVNNSGILVQSESGLYQYYPNSGLSQKVTLEAGSTLLYPNARGIIVKKGNVVALASSSSGAGWNSLDRRPPGITNKATNELVGKSTSVIALEWTEGNRKVISFHNAATGNLLASLDNPPALPKDYNSKIGFAENQTSGYFYNMVFDPDTKKVTTYERPITSVVDGVVYLDNGQGFDIKTQKSLWEVTSNPSVPLYGFFQRQALYIENGTLYLINVNFKPAEASPSTSPTSSTEEK